MTAQTLPPHVDTVTISAPIGGQIVELGQVDDEAFSSGALGPGTAVEPSEGTLVAPLDGEIIAALPHAYGIRSDDLEVLVHFGIDTVQLDGAPFSARAAKGTRVRKGDVLCVADLAAISKAGYAATVIVVVTGGATQAAATAAGGSTIGAGAPLLTVAR